MPRGRMLSDHFYLSEFTRSDWALRHGVDNTPPEAAIPRLEALCHYILEPLRLFIGRPIVILSGYRSPEVNAAIGGVKRSQHQSLTDLDGAAADLIVAEKEPLDVVQGIALLGLPFDQLILEHGSWTHVSYGPRHRREVLQAVRSGGEVEYPPLAIAGRPDVPLGRPFDPFKKEDS